MNYESHKIRELSADDLAGWAELQLADSRFASPFLRPEFAQWLGEVRDDIRVVVIRNGDTAVGFFPYGKCGAAAHPVGTPLSSCQAVVAAVGCCWDGFELLAATRLHRLLFDHWIPEQQEIRSFCSVAVSCPHVDLSEGFDAYAAVKKQQGSQLFSDVRQLKRKLDRDHGAVRCELLNDAHAAERLIAWKSAQCKRTHVADLFSFNWSRQVLTTAFTRATEACGAMLWGLYANDRLIALNAVLRSFQHADGWFMAFDPSYARYSPGMILFHEMLRDFPSQGIARLHLGKGVFGYKQRLMTGSTIVHEGIIDPRPTVRAAWTHWQQTRDWVRRSRLRPLAHRANRILSNARWLLGYDY